MLELRLIALSNSKVMMGSLGTREVEMMNDNRDATGKTIWERMIKQNMVLRLGGRQSAYGLDHKKNSAVEIHFETRYLAHPCQLSKMELAVGRSSDTFDISGAEFLILNRNPALNSHQQHIPWKKISEIVFLDA